MKFYTYLLMALAAVSMAMASAPAVSTPSTFVEIKAEIDLLSDSCSSLSKIPASPIVSVSVAAQISAEIQAVVAVFVDLKAMIQAYVGVLAVVEVDAILAVLVNVSVYLKLAVNILIALQIGGAGNDLLDLQVSVNAFVDAFLAIVPDASKDSATSTCQQIQQTATKGCSDYQTC
ncbi:uncharacterized protein FA14DRAFT_176247 [Meira miltonrushii]|uniref:Uncharacterized protein n=1 Tax=Meira miltonrushii TaxID=1280837 RepID=A0A316VI60_9BASI|nr:uncharacterized protein FA14DRAFT_176247 [Meira miltonrushii]PWN36944.1 hypothetical protein FA14DRAFT_176247 [Meira miltonrushii]